MIRQKMKSLKILKNSRLQSENVGDHPTKRGEGKDNLVSFII